MTIQVSGVVLDASDPAELAKFWSNATGFPVKTSVDGYADLETDDSLGHFFLIKVPEPKTAKNRCHLDFKAEDVDAEVQRLIKLGASKVADHEMYGFPWTVMQDPEGNEFCVSGDHSDLNV